MSDVTSSTSRRPWIVPAIVLAGFIVYAARKGGQLLHPTIWAEDGQEFYGDVLTAGPDFLSVYAGQLWWAQRLLIEGIAVLPVTSVPTGIYLVTCLVAVLAMSVVLLRRASVLFASFRLQVLAFALLVLLPVTWEIQGNLANLQVWLGVSVALLLVMPGPAHWWSRAAELGYALITAATGFVGVILLPLALWRAWTGRADADRGYVWARSAMVVAGALSNLLVVTLLSQRSSSDPVERLVTFVPAVIKRVGGGLLMGDRAIRALWPIGFWSIFLIPAVIMLLLLAYLVWVDRRGPSWILLGTGLLWALAGVMSPAATQQLWWVYDTGGGWRYFAMAVAMSLLIMVRALSGPARLPAAVGLLVCVPGIVLNSYLPAAEPPINPVQMRAFAECVSQPDAWCAVDIAPAGWVLRVPAPSAFR